MSLSDLASIGSFISSAAVLVSLVYVGRQIRQNTHLLRAGAHQSRLDFVQDFLARTTEADMADIYMRGSAGDPSLTQVEFTQYRSHMHSWFLGMAEIAWLHDQGVLDTTRFNGSLHALRANLANPGCRGVWQIIQPLMPPPFRALVDRTIADIERTQHVAPISEFELWRKSLGQRA